MFVSWWQLILIMLTAGFLGGLTNIYITENIQNQKIDRKSFQASIMTGIAASLLVPLFLNTLKSSLIDNLINPTIDKNNINDIFIFFGFCLLAAISSRAFIQSLTNKILQDTQKEVKNATATALGAFVKAEELKTEVQCQNVNLKSQTKEINILKEKFERIFSLLRLGNFTLGSGHPEEALKIFDDIIKEEPDNIEALIGKANALKKIGIDYNDTSSITKALEINKNTINKLPDTNSDKFEYFKARCLYNKACYTVILKKLRKEEIDKSEIQNYLGECFKLSPQFKIFARKDSDFDSIKELNWFQETLNDDSMYLAKNINQQ